MEFEIQIITPGNILSTRTLSEISNDIHRVIERGILEGFFEQFPKISKNKINQEIKGKTRLFYSDFKKGSWETLIIGAIGGLLTWFVTDIVGHHPQYRKIREKIIHNLIHNSDETNNIFNSVDEAIENRFKNATKLGRMIVVEKETLVEIKTDGHKKLKTRITLRRRKETEFILTDKEQIEAFYKSLGKR